MTWLCPIFLVLPYVETCSETKHVTQIKYIPAPLTNQSALSVCILCEISGLWATLERSQDLSHRFHTSECSFTLILSCLALMSGSNGSPEAELLRPCQLFTHAEALVTMELHKLGVVGCWCLRLILQCDIFLIKPTRILSNLAKHELIYQDSGMTAWWDSNLKANWISICLLHDGYSKINWLVKAETWMFFVWAIWLMVEISIILLYPILSRNLGFTGPMLVLKELIRFETSFKDT